jgi:transcriptional antiterminator RfaH
MADWIVARTQVNRQKWAGQNIKAQGYGFYLPMFKDEKSGRTLPLFGCYIFVETQGQWHFLRGTFGIANVVMIGSKPATVSEMEMEQLRRREQKGLIVVPYARFKSGDRVRIKTGLMAGQEGIFQGQTQQQREIVLLNFLGRKSRFLVEEVDLEISR